MIEPTVGQENSTSILPSHTRLDAVGLEDSKIVDLTLDDGVRVRVIDISGKRIPDDPNRSWIE